MTKIDYKNITTAKGFVDAANSLYKRNMSAKKDMQSALICAIKHMEACGDWSSSIKPLLDVGLSFGKNLNVALQEYVLKYTWLELDGKAWAKNKDKVMDLEGALSVEWWTMEKAAKAVPYDFQKALKTFFDGLGKELEKSDTTLDRNSVTSALINGLADVVKADPVGQIERLFDKLATEDKNAMILALMTATPQVQSAAPEVETAPIAEAA